MMAEESSMGAVSASAGDVTVHVPPPDATSGDAAPPKATREEGAAPAAPAAGRTAAAKDLPAAVSNDDEIGSQINDRRHDASIPKASLAKLQWTKGHAGVGINTKTFWLSTTTRW